LLWISKLCIVFTQLIFREILPKILKKWENFILSPKFVNFWKMKIGFRIKVICLQICISKKLGKLKNWDNLETILNQNSLPKISKWTNFVGSCPGGNHAQGKGEKCVTKYSGTHAAGGNRGTKACVLGVSTIGSDRLNRIGKIDPIPFFRESYRSDPIKNFQEGHRSVPPC
jgi:hypothetical protein